MHAAPAAPSASLPRIGTAGWSIPKEHAAAFPAAGSHLERYAAVFDAVEINSSFHRSHKPETYARWAESVPVSFRFAVKVPKAITHERRLEGAGEALDRFLSEIAALGPKLGPLLVQLPPSLPFVAGTADRFLATLRNSVAGTIVCEPRHPSWFKPAVDTVLNALRIARVAADPAPVPGASVGGGWPGTVYVRLHGSPRIYYSAYADDVIASKTAQFLRDAVAGVETWCIFDNTAVFAATGNALTALSLVGSRRANTGLPYNAHTGIES